MVKYSRFIDHTLLKATATTDEIIKLCEEAKAYNFMSVCVNPCFIELAKKELVNSEVLVCSVIGFPLGADTIETKQMAAMGAVNLGADEIDMVINIGKVKEKDFNYLVEEISAVVKVCMQKVVKVIFEICYLTDEEIILLCSAASLSGALFVKTSTGFGTSGATSHAVELMRANISSEMSVKASGGIRTSVDFLTYIKAGASRIGTSGGVQIIDDLKKGVKL